MIYFKETVRIVKYSFALHHILNCLHEIDRQPSNDMPAEIWITSIHDSQHMPASKHYRDEAVDLRSKNFPDHTAKQNFITRFLNTLNSHEEYPDCFSVLFENEGTPNEHIHAQVRKGFTFPPTA